MAEPTTLNQEELTLPIKLPVWAMRVLPKFVSPDDTANAALFEGAHLKRMTREQILAAMHEAAHNRRIAEEITPFLAPFFSHSIGEYLKGNKVPDFGCAVGGTALAWGAMYGVKKISRFAVALLH